MLDVGVESVCHEECMSFGNIAVGYLTLRPNGLAPPAGVELPSPMTSTVSATVVSWIGDTSEFFVHIFTDLYFTFPCTDSQYNQQKIGLMKQSMSPSTSIPSFAPLTF